MAEVFIIGTICVVATATIFTGKKICEVFKKRERQHNELLNKLRVKLLIERRERIRYEEESSEYQTKLETYKNLLLKLKKNEKCNVNKTGKKSSSQKKKYFNLYV